MVGLATSLTVSDGVISDARLAFVEPIRSAPVRATEAEDLLVGEQPSADLFEEAARRATAGLEPPSDLHGSADYRKKVAKPPWCGGACERPRTTPARGSD